MKKKFNYLNIYSIILIIFSITLLFYLNYNTKINISNEINQINNINMCENKSLIETSECLRNYIKTFYNYTIRNDTNKTLEDIKLNGGDCYDYSKIYENSLNEFGFKTKHISIYPDNKDEVGHGFTIVWDKNLTSYCKLDMLNMDCVEFK